jgi:tRNA nucleotidyltransferase (CCA-adding enzyme)
LDTEHQAYPDQARVEPRGDGGGLRNIDGIIHDFIRYNHAMQSDLGAVLRKKLSRRELQLLLKIARQAASLEMPVYLVGGALRDAVLGGPIADLDLLVEGDAIALARTLRSRFGGHVTTHSRFGTAQWALAGAHLFSGDSHRAGVGKKSPDHIDLISSRSEVYPGTAELPRVSPGAIDDDLRRRDFTINTLAVRLDGSHFGEVHDPFGALKDLDRGIIRVLHPASFRDDPTRLYRAVRYEKRYGFRIEPTTLALMRQARPKARRLSSHRIRRELDLILDEGQWILMLKRLSRLELLGAIHPALRSTEKAFRRMQRAEATGPEGLDSRQRRELRWLVWLVELSTAQIRSLDRRLQFTRELREALLAASTISRQSQRWRTWPPSRLTVYLDRFPLLAVQALRSSAPRGQAQSMLAQYIDRWRSVRPAVTSKDLGELGLAPGPAYRQILARLRAAWLDGKISTSAQEREQLGLLIGRFGGNARRLPSGRERRPRFP